MAEHPSSEFPASPPSLRQALAAARQAGLDRVEAQALMLHALQRPAGDGAWLLANDTTPLPAPALAQFEAHTRRRLDGEPVAYLTGHKAFYGLTLAVDARVLDPRADTETLVDWALDLFPAQASCSLLDLGTGSGAIALALQQARRQWQIHALDYSRDALDVARANARRLHLPVQFHQGDWLDGMAQRFDAIVSNPPYIAAGDAHLAALRHEPLQALASGTDGLDAIRRIVQQAPACLCAGGWLLLEHGYDQAAAVRALLQDAGFIRVQSRRDLAGIERCSGGHRA